MKRSFVVALIVGGVAAGLAGILQAAGVLARIDQLIASIVLHGRGPATTVGLAWIYLLGFVLAFGIGWLTLTSRQRGRIGLLVLILLVELVAAAWVCGLYRIAFQPVPSIGAILLAFLCRRTLGRIFPEKPVPCGQNLFRGSLVQGRTSRSD